MVGAGSKLTAAHKPNLLYKQSKGGGGGEEEGVSLAARHSPGIPTVFAERNTGRAGC